MSPIVLGLGAVSEKVPGSVDTRVISTTWGRTAGGHNPDAPVYPVVDMDVVWTGHLFSLDVPRDAIITSASFVPYARNNFNWGDVGTDIDLGAEQVDDAIQFSSVADALARKDNWGTPVTWIPAREGTQPLNGNPIPGEDISSVIQAIVNRPGWEEGNNILIITQNGSGGVTGTWHGADATESLRPQLLVDYLA